MEDTLMEQLKTLRKLFGVQQQVVAARLGVSKQALWKMEKGITVPTLPMLYKYADAIGVTIEVKVHG